MAPYLEGQSWDVWRGIVAKLDDPRIKEVYIAAGRRSAKSTTAARVASYFATRTYTGLQPGEAPVVCVFAPTTAQAAVTWRMIRALIPERLVDRIDERELFIGMRSGVEVRCLAANPSTLRGRAIACAVLEEAAWFRDPNTSKQNDAEILRAASPSLRTIEGSLCMVISSPGGASGILYDAVERNAVAPDPSVLVVNLPSRALNPLLSEADEKRDIERDPQAESEWLGVFRSGSDAWLPAETIQKCVVPGRAHLARQPGVVYVAFFDASLGSNDDWALCVVHGAGSMARIPAKPRGDRDPLGLRDYPSQVSREYWERRWLNEKPDVDATGKIVIDRVTEWAAGTAVSTVAADVKDVLGRYSITVAHADRVGGTFARALFDSIGIELLQDAPDKSELYRLFKRPLQDGLVELPDHKKLIQQLKALKTDDRGKTDHPRRHRDDAANCCAGAAHLIEPQKTKSNLVPIGAYPMGSDSIDLTRRLT